MKRRSEAAAAIVGVSLLAAPAVAQAYCRTANCPSHDGAWQVCVPAEADDCGTMLWWRSRCLGFTIQKDASSQVNLADTEKTFKTAFDTWMNADCGGGKHPSVTIDYQGPVECDKQEYNKDKDAAEIQKVMDDLFTFNDNLNEEEKRYLREGLESEDQLAVFDLLHASHGYFRVARFHGHLELMAGALLLLERRRA